jgi:hypothetical protein
VQKLALLSSVQILKHFGLWLFLQFSYHKKVSFVQFFWEVSKKCFEKIITEMIRIPKESSTGILPA